MKFKKVASLLLSAAMVVGMLAGCGGNSGTDDAAGNENAGNKEEGSGTVLTFAAFEGGNGTEFLQKIADAFEAEHEGVTIELKTSPEIDKDITKDIQNGKVPDIVYYNLGQPSGFTETMLKEEAIADISDVFDDELKGKLIGGITDNAVAQPYADGKIYLAPFIYTPTGFWYNKDLFEGENKKYDLPTTWDEFFALGDQAKKDGIALFTYPTSGYFDTTIYQMLTAAGGSEFYTKAVNYDANTWSSEQGKKVIDTLAKLVSPDYLQADTVANATSKDGFKINQQNVIDGKALFMPNGNWVIGEMVNSTPEGFNWGMMAQPKFDAKDPNYVYTFTEQIWVPADAPNLDLAKEFIKFMYSDTAADIMMSNQVTNKETGETSPQPLVSPLVGASDALEDGPIKDSYTLTSTDGYEMVSGVWATTESIEGFDMNATVYGAIDGLAQGDLKVEDYQKQLVDAWAQLAENVK